MDIISNNESSQFSPQSIPMDDCNRSMALFFTNDYGNWGWITKVTFPVLLAIGSIGNVAGIIIANKCKGGSQRTFLLCLYCINIAYLWNDLIVLIGTKTWASNPNEGSVYESFFDPIGGVWFYSSDVLYLASQWVLLLFCFDRSVAVTFPLYHFTSWQRSFATVTVTLAFVAAALNSLLTPVTYYWYQKNQNFASNSYVQEMPEYLSKWKNVDVWWEVLFGLVVYLLIFICNMVLLYALGERKRRWSSDSTSGLDADFSGSISVDRTQSNRTQSISSGMPGVQVGRNMNKWIVTRTKSCSDISKTRLLFASSLFYLVTQSLKMILPSLQVASQSPFCTFHLTMTFLIPWDAISSLLVNIYFAFNFIFLVLVGPLERKKCCLLYPRKRT